MIGAIIGDIVGSVYEFNNIKTTDFPLLNGCSRFTDDTVMTVAIAEWLLSKGDLAGIMQQYGKEYPDVGYGGRFRQWLRSPAPEPYNSWGNGSAMRVSPVGWAYDTLDQTLEKAKQSALVTHNHPEGIKGAQSVAACIFLARNHGSKTEIRAYVERTFGYNLHRNCDEIRPDYTFHVSCQKSVPEAIIAFLDSSDFENAIRLAVSLGGDSDTVACVTGGIAEAYYKEIPRDILLNIKSLLPESFKNTVKDFYVTHKIATSEV